jgi:hypothetical protein
MLLKYVLKHQKIQPRKENEFKKKNPTKPLKDTDQKTNNQNQTKRMKNN